MKTAFFSVLMAGLFTLSSCANNDNNSEKIPVKENENTHQDHSTHETEIKEVTAKYTQVDSKVTDALNIMADQYLNLKNALIADNGNEAAVAAEQFNTSISEVRSNLSSADQLASIEGNLKRAEEMSKHISGSANNIEHQRERFAQLSDDVYSIVTTLGFNRQLFVIHCPMYLENKGARWLNETKEVKNPYYGSKMLKCGNVQEVVN